MTVYKFWASHAGKIRNGSAPPPPPFALVMLSGAHRLDSGRPAVPDCRPKSTEAVIDPRGTQRVLLPFLGHRPRHSAAQAAASHSLRHAIAEPRPQLTAVLADGCRRGRLGRDR